MASTTFLPRVGRDVFGTPVPMSWAQKNFAASASTTSDATTLAVVEGGGPTHKNHADATTSVALI